MTVQRVWVRSVCLAMFLAAAGCAANWNQAGVGASAGSTRGQVSVSYFHETLSPYGEWFQEPSYGWCWTPYDASANWRPYSDGHWVYTDYGWSWASNESWGWAPYHYGRWFFDGSYGWVWVPGTDWAPAWVAWRYADDCVGWAPLPPTAGWNVSAGLSFSDADEIPSRGWCFVARGHMLDSNLRPQLNPVARNVTLLGRSRRATRFEVRNGRPANVGLDLAQVEGYVGRRVPPMKIVDAGTPVRGGGWPAGNGGVSFYRPEVRPTPVQQVPAPAASTGRRAIPDADLQRLREQQQKKLEQDLGAERARLARDQQNELRSQAAGKAADEIRKRQAAEQQAFEAHAAEQRQVLEQRLRKRVVNPGKDRDAAQPEGKGKGRDKGDR